MIQRTVTLTLTEEQVDVLDAIGFLRGGRWARHARAVLLAWIEAESHSPSVQRCMKARRMRQGRKRLRLVNEVA